MFVFYDTETTGTNIVFDQILQFAAILTDDHLREIERFELKCRILPWVVPSPMALLVTNTAPSRLDDPSLPTLFEMMAFIRKQLEAWSPATFLGYNSIRFDEPLLQRAFWQTLNPPYLTVTNGNARSDVLPLVQAASQFADEALEWPEKDNGRLSFKLDQLAPLNGFNHVNAHDALGDVEATIFVAKLLAERAPELWTTVMARASKSATASVLSFGVPVLLLEHFAGSPSVWFGQRIDQGGGRASRASVVRLAHDWRSTARGGSEILRDSIAETPKVVRQIALNRAPLVFTTSEAATLFGIAPSQEEKAQSEFLVSDTKFAVQISTAFEAQAEPWPKAEELEQMIYDGFPSREDEDRMEDFQRVGWRERAKLIGSFDARRFCHLALRLIYESAPDLLQPIELERFEIAIGHRLHSGELTTHPWRSIADALHELSEIGSDFAEAEQVLEIEDWFKKLELRYPASLIN
jgi:exodeoxyribonuclease-1